jgi:uncharacterized protein DUF6677
MQRAWYRGAPRIGANVVASDTHDEFGSAAGPRRLSAFTVLVCILATWIVPGAGHWLLGRRRKALLYFALITFTYLFGMWLADFRNVRLDQESMDLYFLGEAVCGGLTLPAWFFTRSLELVREQPLLDAGLLFSTVAGLLNLCIMVDVYETACPRAAPTEGAPA